jgi:hypothetical protein
MDLLEIIGTQKSVDNGDSRNFPVYWGIARRLENEMGRVLEFTT